MSKELKMNEKRVIRALKRWSPHGLCGGTLVQANGDPKKTEACSVGCLALEFAFSKPGLKFFKSKIKAKAFTKKSLYEKATVSDFKFNEAMYKYYGIDSTGVDHIMGYNDSVIGAKKANDSRYKELPVSVRKTIYGLRKEFEAFDRKREREYEKREREEEKAIAKAEQEAAKLALKAEAKEAEFCGYEE